MNKIHAFLLRHKLLVSWFLLSLSFFLWQHSTGFSWDFAVYAMNGQHFFSNGHYFEWLRPPLAPVMMGILGEYLFIVAVSLLHVFSSIKIADKLHVDRTKFYVFSMSIFTLSYGFFAGTELLSLALVQLFIAYLEQPASGIFLGLSIMARYSSLPFGLLLVFVKNRKSAMLSMLAAVSIAIPWLAYNYYFTGNPFASFLDNYILNVQFRQAQLPDVIDFLLVMNIVLPLFALGLRKKDKNRMLLLSVMAVAILPYLVSPFKEARYLFLLAIPMAYFASRWTENRKDHAKILAIFAVCTLALLVLFPVRLEGAGTYMDIASKLDCATLSNIWVPLSYYGAPSAPLIYSDISLNGTVYHIRTDIANAISDGYRVVVWHLDDPFRGMNIDEKYLIRQADDYDIIGDTSRCKPPAGYNETYASALSRLACQQLAGLCSYILQKYPY